MLAELIERSHPTATSMELVTLTRPGPVAERAAGRGVRVRALGGRGLPIAFCRLARLLARERFDVVNAYGFKATAVARVLVRLLSPRSRFVCGIRGLHPSEVETLDSFKARFVLFCERVGAPLVDVYDANSEGALDLLASLGVPRDKMRYIPNGIDASAWAGGHRNGTGPVDILCVARFVPRKRQRDLVDAVAQLSREGVRCTLFLAGDGPTKDEVSARAHATNADIRFLGEVVGDDLRELYRSADVFCLPSTWEGMAGSVMEAMASGLPVVGSDVSGIKDLVVDGVTGLLVEPCNPAHLADALRELLLDHGKRAALGAAGRRRIEDEFSIDRMVDEKERLYQEIAGS